MEYDNRNRRPLTLDYSDWIVVHAYGEWQVSDGPIGERCCSYDFDTKAEAEEYLKWLKEELRHGI